VSIGHLDRFSASAVTRRPWRFALLLTVMLAMIGPGSARSAAPGPHWKISSTPLPTYFKAGDPADVYSVVVMNDGGGATNGGPVTVADALPPGLTATKIEASDLEAPNEFWSCTPPGQKTIACTYPHEVSTGSLLLITVRVAVAANAEPIETNLVTVSGGGAQSASASDPTTIGPSPVPFGLSNFASEITDASGNSETQAGAHPFQMTTSLTLNSSALEAGGFPLLNSNVRDIEVALPPGLVGDPGAVPQCSQETFQTAFAGLCPADTQVGYMRLFFYTHGSAVQFAPIYNLAPPPGQPAELGFTVGLTIHIPMFFHVRNDGDYGLTAQLKNISEGDPVRASILTLWGEPADPGHNSWRFGEAGCEGCASDAPLKPFLTLPTSCQSKPPPALEMAADSWQSPGAHSEEGLPNLLDPSWVTVSAPLPAVSGCNRLSFSPSISAVPDSTQSGAPSGYAVDLRVPQNDNPAGLATSTLRDATVTLPAGTVVSPGVADGLQACTDEEFALRSQAAATCPQAAQLGTVLVHTPLLPSPLVGELYVGQPDCGPCSPSDAQSGKLVRLFLQVQGSGVTVKLEGRGSIGQGTGALTATFKNNPQLPFDDLQVTLNGGPRAPLANPTLCGPATTTADLRPWSSPFTPDATPSSSFAVTGCGPAQFHPAVSVGTVDNQAGAFGPLTLTLTRSDSEQDLGQLTLRTPPGLLGLLSKVALCEEPLAARGECPEASKIGHVIVGAGAGSNPLYVPQAGKPQAPVYLTGPYRGAPFGLSIAVPAEAGPFNLGTVVVRSAINVDPNTSQVTVTSDPLPTTLDGVPLHVRTINVTIDREGFMFNPTSCQPLSVAGEIASDEGMSSAFSSRFQAANCALLRFRPSFKASTAGAASAKGNGASLHVGVTAAEGPPSSPSVAGEANIKRVDVQLPKALPARLSTLQQACTAAQFEANPAGCPAASYVGSALAHSPVLKGALTGPAILVSHGGAGFPDVVIVLQGEGVVLDLTGHTLIRHGITYSKFDSVPDAPISSFALSLPQGKHSALASNKGNLCGQALAMPTMLEAQDGAAVRQTTKITVTGCRVAHRRKVAARHSGK
jgi:hypothetical protein